MVDSHFVFGKFYVIVAHIKLCLNEYIICILYKPFCCNKYFFFAYDAIQNALQVGRIPLPNHSLIVPIT
jgi:hypothetical protein